MTANTNPKTGIRYGVISLNSLDPDLGNDLFYNGRNLSEEEALDELRVEAGERFDDVKEEAEDAYGDGDREQFIEDFIATKLARHHNVSTARYVPTDREEYIDWVVEREGDFMIDEPFIEGECEGVKYQISWLGGAPLLWVTEGPIGYANQLCSPCVPNAADLDGGFIPGNSDDEKRTMTEGYMCYVVPKDWLRGEEEE